MGSRVRALAMLGASAEPVVVVCTAEAAMQRVAPPDSWSEASREIGLGASLDMAELESFLHRSGYVLDERVDEPGEVALRGSVIDIFVASRDLPVRIDHADGEVTAIHVYDPATQRTLGDLDRVVIDAASEVIEAPDSQNPTGTEGLERKLIERHPNLVSLFDYRCDAPILIEPAAEERRAAFLVMLSDLHESGAARMYFDADAWRDEIAERIETLEVACDAVPHFAASHRPAAACADYLAPLLQRGIKAALPITPPSAFAASKRIASRLGLELDAVESWTDVQAAALGVLCGFDVPFERGFQDDAVVIVTPGDLLGSKAGLRTDERTSASLEMMADLELRLGDAVVHADHGVAELKGLEPAAMVGGGEVVRLAFAKGETLLVPALQMGRIWRYGAEVDTVTLDRLTGTSWSKRRAAVEKSLDETAAELLKVARGRAKRSTTPIVPPANRFERFAARFPFPLTPDQSLAIRDTLDDLASGRPMDRLVCGDVGFGKTEVALRAAAAVALAGRQVAVAAPTTVLARQHVDTFRRRFAGLGIEIAHLSRVLSPAEARAARKGLADGSIGIVVGTQAVVAQSVRFADLALVIIDEEQRFGAKDKAKLRDRVGDGHVLTLTATPIPRTMQQALAGLTETSVIATPPLRRMPVRTMIGEIDRNRIAAALRRERAKGGQSFVVCPRIEDLGGVADLLTEVAGECDVVAAHGKMPAGELDAAIVDFAGGRGDVLLSTNIIESGLDIPRANTMVVWRADRFGLSQLHQLRGRVGRGRARGVVHLLTEPGTEISPATRKRLETLAALDRLGAGFAVSARDLDQRGGGDLFGEEQSGHARLLGVGLAKHMLRRAILKARGEASPDWTPDLNIGDLPRIPESYVPEVELRIGLYAAFARADDPPALAALREEIEDRFGSIPPEVDELLAMSTLVQACRRWSVGRIDAGPAGIALTPREVGDFQRLKVSIVKAGGRVSDASGKLVAPAPSGDRVVGAAGILTLLTRVLGEAEPIHQSSEVLARAG
jgi:transcription-repair coupling factor (superfamily II helicase)